MLLQTRTATRLGALFLAAGLLALAAYVGLVILTINSEEYAADSWLIDFTAFWGAAKLALAGQAASAFDVDTLTAVQGARPLAGVADMRWLYPPGWLVLVMPLGLLPFSAAWVAFGAISAAAFLAVMRPLARPVPGALVWLLAAPAVLLSLAIGNNSLLTAACMTAAVASLVAGQQTRAGLLFALMTMKPSLGLLVPPVLLAGRQWTAILWATGGAIAVAALPTMLFGLGYWPPFFAQFTGEATWLETGTPPFPRMITWYGLVRTARAGHDAALAVQVAATAAVMIAVGALWIRRTAGPDIRAAAFLLGLTLATPYAYYYETALALAGILFLLRARPRWPAHAWALFCLIWLVPAIGLGLSAILPVALIAAPLQSLALALAIREGFRDPGPGTAA